jgi:hypothetical protein
VGACADQSQRVDRACWTRRIDQPRLSATKGHSSPAVRAYQYTILSGRWGAGQPRKVKQGQKMGDKRRRRQALRQVCDSLPPKSEVVV